MSSQLHSGRVRQFIFNFKEHTERQNFIIMKTQYLPWNHGFIMHNTTIDQDPRTKSLFSLKKKFKDNSI